MKLVYQRLSCETGSLRMPRRKLINGEAKKAIGMLQGSRNEVVVAVIDTHGGHTY